MVIAAGPRIVSSTQGPIANYYDNPQSPPGSPISFNVTFDRPIDPPALGTPTFTAGRRPGLLSRHHQRRPSIPLRVSSVTPVLSSGVGPDNKFGFTEFTVTFDPTTQPDAHAQRHHQLHRHIQLRGLAGRQRHADHRADPVVCRHPVALPHDRPGRRRRMFPCAFRTSGTGGSGTSDDITTSTITIANANYNNAIITSLTVNLTLDHQRDGDLFITLDGPQRQHQPFSTRIPTTTA